MDDATSRQVRGLLADCALRQYDVTRLTINTDPYIIIYIELYI